MSIFLLYEKLLKKHFTPEFLEIYGSSKGSRFLIIENDFIETEASEKMMLHLMKGHRKMKKYCRGEFPVVNDRNILWAWSMLSLN